MVGDHEGWRAITFRNAHHAIFFFGPRATTVPVTGVTAMHLLDHTRWYYYVCVVCVCVYTVRSTWRLFDIETFAMVLHPLSHTETLGNALGLDCGWGDVGRGKAHLFTEYVIIIIYNMSCMATARFSHKKYV